MSIPGVRIECLAYLRLFLVTHVAVFGMLCLTSILKKIEFRWFLLLHVYEMEVLDLQGARVLWLFILQFI